MKHNIFYKQITLLMTIGFAGIMLAAGCQFAGKNGDTLPDLAGTYSTANLPADSLFTPTGNVKLDSLLYIEATSESNTNMVILYLYIAKYYIDNDIDKSAEYLYKLRDLSEQLDYNTGRFQFFRTYPFLLERIGLADSALAICQQGIEWARKVKNERWIAEISLRTASVYGMKEWYSTELQYFMEALSYFEPTGEIVINAYIYSNLGSLYLNIDLPEKSVEYCEKACRLEPDDHYHMIRLADACDALKQYEKAKSLYEEALRISEKQNNAYTTGVIYFYLAEKAIVRFELDEAESYIHKALEINKQNGNLIHYNYSLVMLGRLEAEKGNLSQSEKHTQEALKAVIDLDKAEAQRMCYLTLADIAFAQLWKKNGG